MKDLPAIFESVGCSGVHTYIQSGNVVFNANSAIAKRVPGAVAAKIAEQFGFPVPVVVRTIGEMREATRNNPYLKMGVETELLSVMFLADLPDAADVAKLDPERSPPDTFRVLGREIFAHTPNGLARTKLTNAYFDSKLKTVSTIRNWRTVLKLVEMMEV
jgi:uncharacterized protein (DUF1697 family)